MRACVRACTHACACVYFGYANMTICFIHKVFTNIACPGFTNTRDE